MDEILSALLPSARVLDLGSSRGSFDVSRFPHLHTTRLDLEASAPGTVKADAARLPFADASFHAVIANHSLEHFADLDQALREIGRVAHPEHGALYVAVPDATTLTDRLYRWLAHGGGHVNPFTDPAGLAARIAGATGLPHRATRTLCSSLSFLNRRNHPVGARPPRKLWLLGGGNEAAIVCLNALFRRADRAFGTRASLYGWAFYFGAVPEPIDLRLRANMCARCGAGHLTEWLRERNVVDGCCRYRCPACGARNIVNE